MNRIPGGTGELLQAIAFLVVMFSGVLVVNLIADGIVSGSLFCLSLAGWVLLVLIWDRRNIRRQMQRRADHAHQAHTLRRLAARLGMLEESGGEVLSGRRGDVWLRITLTDPITVVASHRLPLPARLKIRSRQPRMRADHEPLNNPILDGALVATGLDSLDLSSPALTGPMMAILHRHPEAILDSQRITVTVTDPDALDELLDDLVALRTHLKEVCS